MRTFSMPPAEYPEPCLPDSIAHGLDYMLCDGGGFEFYYNYLDYFWRVDGAEVRARHYLGRSEPDKVAVMMSLQEFDQPKFAGLLAYLQRRYPVIETFEPDDGYTVRWVAAGLAQRTVIEVFHHDVRHILLQDWDPLRVRDHWRDSGAYDSCGKTLAAMLVGGASSAEVAAYLLEIEVKKFELHGSAERAQQVAEKLCALANLPASNESVHGTDVDGEGAGTA
jgi:hypothetical protein